MLAGQKIQPDSTAFLFAALLVFFVLARYGRQAMEWLLMKLHEFFIQRSTL